MMLLHCPKCQKTYARKAGYCDQCHIELEPLTLISAETISLESEVPALPSLASLLFCGMFTALVFALLP